jgi:hypothetical protein
MVVMFLAMFSVVGRSDLLGVFCLGLGLANNNETIIFQLADLLLFEFAHFWLRTRTGAFLSRFSHFWLSLVVLGLVLTAFAGLLVLSAAVVSSGTFTVSPSTVISVVPVVPVVPVSTPRLSVTATVVPATIALFRRFFNFRFSNGHFNLLCLLSGSGFSLDLSRMHGFY